ncbi:uncharacterized protein G2W53_033036 [Senna tora]|uniref:Uncharacterized protein n=1 Tax=Senna tora TaxID=362788 RepID=A0A834W6R6_9FABA|nr:uncharacterized protein G2W53_033036 [Senna tora]
MADKTYNPDKMQKQRELMLAYKEYNETTRPQGFSRVKTLFHK